MTLSVLTFASLFPNAVQPRHGIFVENRLRHLLSSGRVESRVVAPVPWFPFRNERFGRYADFARVPRAEQRQGIPVLHPRYPLVPGPGYLATPLLMAAALRTPLARLFRQGHPADVIDAYYLYPDGVAAALLGAWLGRPVVLTALGTDVNLIARQPLPGRMIRWAASRAAGVTTVSAALKHALTDLGVPGSAIRVIRHGVDLERFRPPPDRAAARRALGITRPTLLAVGNLLELKGHHLMIEALAGLPGHELLVAGTGEERGRLEALAARLGVGDRVRFLGHVDHADLHRLYGAADALLIASSREGIPNVLMEALACGTPAVATRVGGIPEVMTAPASGRLLPERTAPALADAVRGLLAAPPDRAATRRTVEAFTWERTTAEHLAVLEAAVAASRAVRPTGPRTRTGIPRSWHRG